MNNVHNLFKNDFYVFFLAILLIMVALKSCFDEVDESIKTLNSIPCNVQFEEWFK